MFRSLLIANRGEIAVRVMRTAQRMGLRTIAVYSDADAGAMHVALADEAVRIGPAAARESYLSIEAVLAAAKATGAEAIHPGYGFLSENAKFAEACAAAKIAFVGPPPSAIRAMGLKDRAKALMRDAGVPVVPGYLGDDQSPSHLAAEAAKIGYPVLIKAVAGGGGKGMRRVEAAADFDAALESAKREAKSAFNDDRVLIEKYVSRPRHIEVQVFADAHGNAVHLFERDCSLQRRHQKVIEEAPAPGMSEAMRASIGAAAVKAAQAVNYVGAGTVEFIADASEGLRPDRIWFMEMNTRLQVEHPVTEAITGLDLVEWQLLVAAGRKLPKQQHELKIKGHAIEARLYAEDPRKGFLPSIGALQRLRFGEAENIRIDTGVREGDAVTPFYDPMIAKVIACDDDRKGAAARLATSLAHTQVAGVATNAGFLVRALRNNAFLAGDIDTGFIDRHLNDLTGAPPAASALPQAVEFLLSERMRGDHRDPWDAQDGFRLSGEAREHLTLTQGDERFPVEIVHKRGETQIVVAGKVQPPAAADGAIRLASGEIAVMHNGDTQLFALYDPFESDDSSAFASDRITAPMPGKVIQLLVKSGDKVKRGTPLAILEAMKMENTLSAQADATVAEIAVSVGDQVGEGALILTFESETKT
ncbi:MAG TPA: biotin carboxylase N-terminal domain-containing protein [Rhizomicrobium sp.]|nr:biotin carboxylase N-terminal domain-containing protein [Rhizomicrobium sp.]